jgi:hypothetical protein
MDNCYKDPQNGNKCTEICSSESHYFANSTSHACEEKKYSDRVFNSTANRVCGKSPWVFDANDNYKCSDKCSISDLYEANTQGICVLKSMCTSRTII